MRCVPVSVPALVQTSVRPRPEKLSITNVAYPQSLRTGAHAVSAFPRPPQPCVRTTAGNGPGPAGKRRSPEMTTGSAITNFGSSDLRARVPAVANEILPESVAEEVGFRSFKAGAQPAQRTTARARNWKLLFMAIPPDS